jgi:hypothetical protein
MGLLKNILIILSFIVSTIATNAQNIPSYVPKNGLVGYWPFNGNANDESGNGNNGTVMGAVSKSADRNGILNSGYQWPNSKASSNYINLGNLDSQLPDSITISTWVYFDTAATRDSRVVGAGEMGIMIN